MYILTRTHRHHVWCAITKGQKRNASNIRRKFQFLTEILHRGHEEIVGSWRQQGDAEQEKEDQQYEDQKVDALTHKQTNTNTQHQRL